MIEIELLGFVTLSFVRTTTSWIHIKGETGLWVHSSSIAVYDSDLFLGLN